MFESSLIDLDAKQHSRRKWAPLPIAIALHGAVLASVGVAQVWNVAQLGEPEIVTPFHVSFVPPLEQAATGGREKQPEAPPKPRPEAPVQPDVDRVPDAPVPDSEPDTSTGLAVSEGRSTGEGVEGSVDVGPSDGFLPGPGSADAPVPSVSVAAPAQDEILTVGGAVSRPVLLRGEQPRYSKIALGARIQGTVILRAVIDERGFVADVQVLSGLSMGLDQAVVDTVRDWVFEPAKLEGRPVKVRYTLTVKFELRG